MTTTIISFSIDKLGGAVYGAPAWELFWGCILPEALPHDTQLYCGDIHDFKEPEYAIAIISEDPSLPEILKTTFSENASYVEVSGAQSVFTTNNDLLAKDNLVLVGEAISEGEINWQGGNWAKDALSKIRNLSQLEENRKEVSGPRSLSIRHIWNSSRAEIADMRFRGAAAELSTSEDGQLVIEITLKGEEPEMPDFETDEEMYDYYKTQILVDSNTTYTIEYTADDALYSVTASCLGSSESRYSFYIPHDTKPKQLSNNIMKEPKNPNPHKDASLKKETSSNEPWWKIWK